MKLLSAHARLRELGAGTFTTRDAAALLEVTPVHASQILKRLGESGHVYHLARGRWALPDKVRPFALPEALTAPLPSYVSLYTALYHHGFIEQIPEVVYAVTLAPTRRVTTPVATVSLHQVAPAFFTGFEIVHDLGAKLASPEKALVDTLYLRPARSGLFRALPELELPARFSRARARAFTQLIESRARRSLVERELQNVLARR